MARRSTNERPQSLGGLDAIQVVRSGECRIAYRVLGESGAYLFVLPPFWIAAEDFAADPMCFGPQLLAKHRVIVMDRRGTGGSDRHPGLVDMKAQAGDVVAVLDDLGLERVPLLAWAESAPLAVYVAAHYVERVSRLALIDPQLRPRTGPGSTMLLHTLHSRPRAGLKAFASSITSDEAKAEDLVERMAGRLDSPTAARLYEAFLNADALSLAPQVAARTLLGFGVHEKVVLGDEATLLQSYFVDTQLGLVEGTPGELGAAREVGAVLLDFLAGLPVYEPVSRRIDGMAPAGVQRPAARAGVFPTQAPGDLGPLDFVPAAPPRPAPRPLSATIAPHLVQTPRAAMRWGQPVEIPREAVELNRKAIDLILLGQIESALEIFQQALEVAPEYEDAAINYRELLSRLVQRRVAQWQEEQAELTLAEAAKRAERYAKRQQKTGGRLGVLRLFKPNTA